MADNTTLPVLQARRDQLQRAIDSGVLSLKFDGGDKTTTYQSRRDQMAALADMDRRLAKLEGTSIRPRRVGVLGRSGW